MERVGNADCSTMPAERSRIRWRLDFFRFKSVFTSVLDYQGGQWTLALQFRTGLSMLFFEEIGYPR